MTNNSHIFRPESYEAGSCREWLVANGLGGYASSTAVGANTRAYHGLLVAALDPPAERRLLLSSLDEEISGLKLSSHQYPGAIYPHGYKYLKEFSFRPLPRFLYKTKEVFLDKTVFMIHLENTSVVSYKARGCGRFRILPLVHCRSFHAASELPKIWQEPLKCGVILKSDCRLCLLSDRARYQPDEMTYYNFEYDDERRRGLQWRENLFNPGFFELDLDGEIQFSISASTWRRTMPDVASEMRREVDRLNNLKAPIPRLAIAADAFLVQRNRGRSIIAGYHWFDDWGRDAMISLPGLLLTTERFNEAKAVLLTFAGAMQDGVLPNDLAAKSYNTVDASLWFIQAAYSFFKSSGDLEFIRLIWPAMQNIFKRYSRSGKDFGMDSDSLLISGPGLTWMDARVNGQLVTPRFGKCCEINALWYDGLNKLDALAEAMGEGWEHKMAEEVKESYQKFWNSESSCLFDVIDPEDASIRPNQIFAAAIPGLLPSTKRRSILEVVTRDLLTPYGLRTLSPRDPRYIGKYEGGPGQRDFAYHQGTAWPWLMGAYIKSLLSINDYSDQSIARGTELLQTIAEIDQAGIGTISEVFDGDPPHRPGGCISQAWSVAEILSAARSLILDQAL